MPVEHFVSKEAERKSNAYRHIHGIPAPNRTSVIVAGKEHKVKHSSLSRPKPQAERRLKRYEQRHDKRRSSRR